MKQRFNSFFDGVSPEVSNEEFLGRVLRKAENMETKNRMRIKPLAAAAAAVAVLSAGVTVAGAAGLLNFNRIFGGFITAQDSSLGESLVAGLESFEYSVSDPDYIIVPNGITGSNRNYILSFDIRRADGKPVADFLPREVFGEQLCVEYLDDAVKNGARISKGGGINSVSVNTEGNITVIADRHTSEELEGSTIRFVGSNLYVTDEMIAFRHENNVLPVFADGESIPIDLHNFNESQPLPICETEYFEIDNEYTTTHNDVILTDIDDSSIRLLDLDWNFSFRCNLSDTAAQALHAVDVSEKALVTGSCSLTDVEVNSTGGILRYNSSSPLSLDECRSFMRIMHDIRLITSDGEEITARTDGASGSLTELNVLFWYYGEDGEKIAANLDEIIAISINDVVYALEQAVR